MSRSNAIKNSKEYHCPLCESTTVHISPSIAKPLIPVACGNCQKNNEIPIYNINKNTKRINGEVKYVKIDLLRDYNSDTVYLNERAINRLKNNELIPLGYNMKGSKKLDKIISKIKNAF